MSRLGALFTKKQKHKTCFYSTCTLPAAFPTYENSFIASQLPSINVIDIFRIELHSMIFVVQ